MKAVLLAYPLTACLEKDFPTLFSKEVEMPFVTQAYLGPTGPGSLLLERDPSGSSYSLHFFYICMLGSLDDFGS